MTDRIAIIGGGNLGISIARGLLSTNEIPVENITVTRRRLHKIEFLEKEGIKITDNNVEAIADAGMIILAIKPNQAENVLSEIREKLNPDKQIIISAITGFKFDAIEKIVGRFPLYRIMPNTAIAIRQSMTCIAKHNTSDIQDDDVISFFNSLGKTVIINEELMAASTVLAACGIAFAMRFMRASAQAGVEMGFGSELAQHITTQTLKGAAELILENGNHPEKEIDKVTTPMGITISGLNEMEYQGFSSSLIKGLMTSFNKIANAG